MELATERIDIPRKSGGSMGGYLARPAGDKRLPAVIVYMEIFGINSHIRDVTERVAREGHVAIAPDYFHRTGPGIELGYDDDGMNRGIALMNQLRADEMVADARDTISYLRHRDDVIGERIGAMGFCIGGHMTYLTACETDVAASASFYGGGVAGDEGPGGSVSTLSRTSKIGGRILCFFGGADSMIPTDQVERVRNELEEHQIEHEVVVYDGLQHGFFCDQRDSYDAKGAADAWERTRQLFASELRG